MRSKALKNKLEEQSLRDVQRYMDPGSRPSNILGSTQAKGLRAVRSAMKKAGEEYSENPVTIDNFDIATKDEIASNITQNVPEQEKAMARQSAADAKREKRLAQQELIGKAEAENVELLSRVQNLQMGQRAREAKKAREEQEKAMAKLQDRASRQTGTSRASQRGTGELSPLAARQAGAKPVTQAGVDFSGAFDRRAKSAAAQGKGAVSGLDFSTAVRPGSKDGSEGAASTPTVVTGGQPSLSDPNRPGRLQRTQDYFKNIAAKVPVAAGQLATAAQQQAQQTIANIKRDFENPDLERSQQQTRDAIDFLLDPLPGPFSRKNIARYAVDQVTDKIAPSLDRITTALQPADDTATSVSRATAQQAARTGKLEPFVTGSKASDTPDDFMKLRDPGSDAATTSPTEPTVSQPGKGFGRPEAAADQIRAIQTGKVRLEPTLGASTPTVQTPPPSTTITDLLKATQADPIPSSFAQVGTRRTQKVAAPEFKEPKNFTQLQKLYNKGQITPQQYEMYKDRFLTAESKLEYVRKMFREA